MEIIWVFIYEDYDLVRKVLMCTIDFGVSLVGVESVSLW